MSIAYLLLLLLLSTLKIQVQIVGTVPTTLTYKATLHYQMAHRIQNHSLDFATPQGTDDAILIQMEMDQPNCTYVPKQIPRFKLIKLIPHMWITIYEQHIRHQKFLCTSSHQPIILERSQMVKLKLCSKKNPQLNSLVVSQHNLLFPTEKSLSMDLMQMACLFIQI